MDAWNDPNASDRFSDFKSDRIPIEKKQTRISWNFCHAAKDPVDLVEHAGQAFFRRELSFCLPKGDVIVSTYFKSIMPDVKIDPSSSAVGLCRCHFQPSFRDLSRNRFFRLKIEQRINENGRFIVTWYVDIGVVSCSLNLL